MANLYWVPNKLIEHHANYWAYVHWMQKFLYATLKAWQKEPRVIKVCEKGLEIHYEYVMYPDKHKFDETVGVGLKILGKLHRLSFELEDEKLKGKARGGMDQLVEFRKAMDV